MKTSTTFKLSAAERKLNQEYLSQEGVPDIDKYRSLFFCVLPHQPQQVHESEMNKSKETPRVTEESQASYRKSTDGISDNDDLISRLELLLKEAQGIAAAVVDPYTPSIAEIDIQPKAETLAEAAPSKELVASEIVTPAQVEETNIAIELEPIPAPQPARKKTASEIETKTKNTWNYQGTAKKCTTFIVTPTCRKFLEDIMIGFNKKTKELFIHVLRSSGRVVTEAEGWIPIDSRFIRDAFPGCLKQKLLDAKLIETDGVYSEAKKKCLYYRVNPDILDAYVDAQLLGLELGEIDRFDLMKGKNVRAAEKSKLTDENGNKLPPNVVARIKGYQKTKFNLRACLQFLRQKVATYKQLRDEQGINSRAYRKARAQYISDYWALSSVVLDGGAIHGKDGYAFYTAAYHAQKSGRLTHHRGGFQSASRELTAAAFSGIEEYNNYDMAAAQPRCAIQILEMSGFDASFLKDYINTPKAKYIYSEKIGVNVQTWKDLLIATLMGTKILPLNTDTKETFIKLGRAIALYEQQKAAGQDYVMLPDGSFSKQRLERPAPTAHYNLLLEEFNYDGEKAFVAYQRFFSACQSLIVEIEGFSTWLLTLVGKKKSDIITTAPIWLNQIAGKFYVKNAACMSLDITEMRADLLVSKAMAHLLQGAEAAFMCQIIALSPKYGYKPVQDFHDGAVIEGTVPKEAEEEATKLSGISASLETKPFVSLIKQPTIVKEVRKPVFNTEVFWGEMQDLYNKARLAVEEILIPTLHHIKIPIAA